MGLLDELRRLWKRARRNAAERAAKESAKRSVDAVTERVRATGDEFLDDAEKQLDEARQRREGREVVGPSSSEAEAIEARIRAAAEAASGRTSKPDEAEEAANRIREAVETAHGRGDEGAGSRETAQGERADAARSARADADDARAARADDAEARARAELEQRKAALRQQLYGEE